MRTIQAKKNDEGCICTDEFNNLFIRIGKHSCENPVSISPSENIRNLVVEDVEFTEDEDFKIDESVYAQDSNMIIFDLLVGPRPKNIVRRK